jgi:hypothetical protein
MRINRGMRTSRFAIQAYVADRQLPSTRLHVKLSTAVRDKLRLYASTALKYSRAPVMILVVRDT